MTRWSSCNGPRCRIHLTDSTQRFACSPRGKFAWPSVRRCLTRFAACYSVLSFRRNCPTSRPTVQRPFSKTLEYCDWFESVPAHFTWPEHPKDDHLFNLAIESTARYFVTWETSILKLSMADSPAARRLHFLAPDLRILTPQQLAQEYHQFL